MRGLLNCASASQGFLRPPVKGVAMSVHVFHDMRYLGAERHLKKSLNNTDYETLYFTSNDAPIKQHGLGNWS
jgi:hypothetical protein